MKENKQSAFLPDMYVQIDVMEINDTHVVCNMSTGVLCCKTLISRSDYDRLVVKEFFIRDGKSKDSSQVLNTTEVYTK